MPTTGFCHAHACEEPDPTDACVIIDPTMQGIWEMLARVAASPLPVVVMGETGAGKERAVEWLHRQSTRAARPLVRVNCATLSETLVESELFGHERGAFTGADRDRPGLLEMADGGTLFLDEVGELSMRVQAKLLRVLESGELLRIGGRAARTIDVRFVAATNKNVPELVARGEFREDLWFRLSAVTADIPPLRSRPAEILPLARLVVERLARTSSRPPPSLSAAAEEALQAHAWPGNVRELRHALGRAFVLCRDDIIRVDDLQLRPPSNGGPAAAPSHPPAAAPTRSLRGIREQMKVLERERVLAALAEARGNQKRAAVLLGVSRRTLTNKLNAYAIERPRKSP